MASANNQTGLPVSSALARLDHGIVLGVFRIMGPTLLQVALWGPLKDFLPSMIGVQQCAGLFLVVLGRLSRGRTEPANLLPQSFVNSSACWHSCLEITLKPTPTKLVGVLVELL